MGKSRLIREFLASVDGETSVLRGRCLPYGEGITYWPLAEALREAAGISDSDDRAAAGRKLLALLAGDRDAELIAARLATAIGLSDEPAAQAELFWAVRRTLEHLAASRPLVVVFDDIHWAEPTFLDLVDHLADWSRDVPVVLLTPARPELLDERPNWGGGKLNASTILLETLPNDATERLIDALPGGPVLPAGLRERIAAAAEGNPLFVEELMAMLVDDGDIRLTDGEWQAAGDLEHLAIPPTIQALLAARLDRLSDDERGVAERASVVGRVFEPEAVAALSAAGSAGGLADQLMALVRKELVRPDRSEVTGGDAFKFRHILIRDAAYNALPKRERADLHERFADWLELVVGDRAAEFAEIIGHHLEQARRYQLELGSNVPPALSERATRWLREAAERAWDRWDFDGAMRLFDHAAGVAATNERLDLLERKAWAIRRQGHYRRSRIEAEALVGEAEAAGSEGAALRARLLSADLATYEDSAAIPLVAELLPGISARLEELGDAPGLAIAAYVQSGLHIMGLRFDQSYASLMQAYKHAAASSSAWIETFLTNDRLSAGESGSTPFSVLRKSIETSHTGSAGRWEPGQRACWEADFAILEEGMPGAQSAMDRARATLAEHGDTVALGGITAFWPAFLLYVGDVALAAALAMEAQSSLSAQGNESGRQTVAALAGEALAKLGRADDATPYIEDASLADPSDVITHVIADRARACIELSRGNLEEAEAHAVRAMERQAGAEAPIDRAQSLITLAEIRTARDKPAEARILLAEARELMVAKEAHAIVRRIDAMRADMTDQHVS